VEMFLYLPLLSQCDVDRPPTIDQDAERIAESLRTYQPPAQDNDDDNNNNNNRGRWRQRDNELEALSKAHENRPGWIDVLAWSHGASNGSSRYGDSRRGNMQDLSMTKYSDNYSPLMTVMVMCGEVLPHALLRVCHKPENGTFKVIEMALKGVQVTSISTGGSGGEDRLTENLCLAFQSITIRHVKISVDAGKFLDDSHGSWDGEKNKGHREGLFTVLSLKSLVKKAISSQVDLFDQKQLSMLPKAILEELELGHLSVKNSLPLKGRLLYVTEEEIEENMRKNHFREVYTKQLTVEGLKSAIASLYKVSVDRVKNIYRVLGNALVSIETNDQVWGLAEAEQLNVDFAKA